MLDSQIKEYIKKANDNLKKAYVPYSKFPVSAILIDEKGNEYEGTNIENASYGLSICAERNTIFHAVHSGAKKIRYIFVTGNTKGPISPCGACRQVIKEFSDEKTVIILGSTNTDEYIKMSIDELLPYGFDQSEL